MEIINIKRLSLSILISSISILESIQYVYSEESLEEQLLRNWDSPEGQLFKCERGVDKFINGDLDESEALNRCNLALTRYTDTNEYTSLLLYARGNLYSWRAYSMGVMNSNGDVNKIEKYHINALKDYRESIKFIPNLNKSYDKKSFKARALRANGENLVGLALLLNKDEDMDEKKEFRISIVFGTGCKNLSEARDIDGKSTPSFEELCRNPSGQD